MLVETRKSFEFLATNKTIIRRTVELRLRGHEGNDLRRRADGSINSFDGDIRDDLHGVHGGCDMVASILVAPRFYVHSNPRWTFKFGLAKWAFEFTPAGVRML